MLYTSTVTQKGQITLPKAIREKLGVKPRDAVILRVKGDEVMIESGEDIVDMAGSVKPVKGVEALSTRESLESNYIRG